MIRGIGIDLIAIERIRRACTRLGDAFMNRIFTTDERAYADKKRNPFPHLAGIFAAKEAARKAFGDGIGGVGWSDIEVTHCSSGRPHLAMHGRAAILMRQMGITRTHLSITHDDPQAIAMVIFESPE
ncbi:MAG: holo-ACP synthase [bacterium]